MPRPKSDILDRLPPQDLGAERGVLGSLLLAPAAFDLVAWLRPEDFYNAAHRTLFAVIRAMCDAGQPIDAVLLTNRLKADGKLEAVGGMAALADIARAVPVAAHVVMYARLVAKAAKFRAIIHAATESLTVAYDATDEPDVVLDSLEGRLSHIRTETDLGEPVTCIQAGVEACEEIDRRMHRGDIGGVPTGLWSVDQNFGGLFPGELTILAARPGVGKTSLALQIAAHNAAMGRLVYCVSLEMQPKELAVRLACAESGVSSHMVRAGRLRAEEFTELAKAFQHQSDRLLFHPAGDVTVAGIRREVRKLMRRGLVLFVVDYLQLVAPEDRRVNREQQVATMARGLKCLARDMNVPGLVLCQLNREVDEFTRPSLGHLRESGAIEQDADAVWFPYKHQPGNGENYNAVLAVEKNRNGDTGGVNLNWVANRTRFEDCGGESF